jgi:hypothetical protein
MNRTYSEPLSCASLEDERRERRPHHATELVPVSIERRWCSLHERWEIFGYLRRPSHKSWWSRKAREAFALFIIGEIIAIGALILAGGAIAAMR